MSLSSATLEPNGTLTAGSMAATIEHTRANLGSSHPTVPRTQSPGTHEQPPTLDIDLGGWS